MALQIFFISQKQSLKKGKYGADTFEGRRLRLEQALLEEAQAARHEMPHRDDEVRQVVDLIIDNVNQLRDTQGLKAPARLDSATALFGGEGFLDSMALVTLVVAVEQAIEEKFGTNVSLADPGAMSQEHSPYRTIGALADYALRRLRAA